MIYQTEELLPEIQSRINTDKYLQDKVLLQGKIPHAALPAWYSAADVFVNASHHEGGCTALLEAMACGCIPIVSSIPASLAVTNEGSLGGFFTPGDEAALTDAMQQIIDADRVRLSGKVNNWFRSEYALPAIADKMISAFELARE
jgi:glycosyltransferase involved in cell wall biosynthesis